MNDLNPPKEFRFKRGSRILEYIARFSATEKVVFGALVLLAIVTALIMAARVNDHFLTEIPAYSGSLHEGVVGLPRTVNPVLAVSDVDRDISSLVYRGLMRYEDGAFIPDLASSYTLSDDGLTYTFNLKEDAIFSDGSPLTASDVAFTVQKIQDPALKSPRRADWANVTVRETSPTVIQFVLKQPYAPFLSNTTVGIIPKHIWGAVPDDQFIFSQYNIEPIGAGPYKVASVSRDSGGIPTEYHLSTWNRYGGKEPYITDLYINFFSDEDKALAALDNGTIDSLGSIGSSAAARLRSDSAQAYAVLSAPLSRIFGVFFNQNQNPILADKSVRQALDMSVDRSALVSSILNGYGVPIHGPLPSAGESKVSTSTAATSKMGSADVAGAQAVLAKGGWKKNTQTGIYTKKPAKSASTTLAFELYTADTPELKQAADMLKKQWLDLGADVTIKVFEASDLYQNVIRTRKYDALLFGEQIGKDRDLYAFWHSSQRNAPGLNVALYTNSAADKLLEDIRMTGDSALRNAKYAQFEDIMSADIPAVFLYSPNFIYVVPKALRGIDLHSMTLPTDRFIAIADWYVNTEKVWKIFTKN